VTLDTTEGIHAIRAELERLEAARILHSSLTGSDDKSSLQLDVSFAEAMRIAEDRIACSMERLRELGFTGPVKRV
jgi:hypothetical protein